MEENNDLSLDDQLDEEVNSLSQFLGTAREVVERYTRCSFCGAHLHFTHITDFTKNVTQETARCPECGVRASRSVYKLQ